jgi:hypothetical protein
MGPRRGNILTVTGAGNIVLDANQAGNTNYEAAPQVQQTQIVVATGVHVIAPFGARGRHL